MKGIEKILIMLIVSCLLHVPVYGQGQQLGGDEFLVPISLDNPLELDSVFLNNLWGDLYQ